MLSLYCLQVVGSSLLIGMCILVFNGVCYTLFSPAFNLATNGQLLLSRQSPGHPSYKSALSRCPRHVMTYLQCYTSVLTHHPLFANAPQECCSSLSPSAGSTASPDQCLHHHVHVQHVFENFVDDTTLVAPSTVRVSTSRWATCAVQISGTACRPACPTWLSTQPSSTSAPCSSVGHLKPFSCCTCSLST